MLQLRNFDVLYGTSHVIHDMALSLERGEILCLLGRNGVGKTTLMRGIMGLTVNCRGALELDGADLARLPTYERARRGIGYVPQGRDIVPGLTVLENIRLGLNARSDGRREPPEIIWDLFPMLKEHLGRRGTNLSGGQQQQLAIARALSASPRVLLLDEPTEGIQPNVIQDIETAIHRINREMGMSIIVIEQKVLFARSTAHRFAIMDKGRIVKAGKPEELTDDVMHKYMGV